MQRLQHCAVKPEKTIIAEADNPDEAYQALKGRPDVLQLDKFSPDDIRRLVKDAAVLAPTAHCLLQAG